MPERCLVTGGAGFIGSHIVDLLLKRGYEVRVLDVLQPRVHPNGKPSWIPPEVDFLEGDVADATTLVDSLKDIDFVFHLAAYQDYMTDYSTFIRVNDLSTALMFEIILAEHLRVQKLVFASSQSVAGEGRWRCLEHGDFIPRPRPLEQLEAADWEVHCPICNAHSERLLIDESTNSPLSAYAISKYTVELLAERLGRQNGIPTTCYRYTCVQGPRQSFFNTYSGVARIFSLRLMHGQPPICFEDGLQQRDYVNVSDVAGASLLALDDPRTDHEVFNVGGGRPVTTMEFAHAIRTAFESDIEPEAPGAFRLGDPRHTVADISKLAALGWTPKIPVEENARQYAAWIRDQPGISDFFRDSEERMRADGVIRRARVTSK